MESSARYSIWLVPDGPEEAALQAVIDRLAREHGGPAFPPHLTLFGSLVTTEADVLARSEQLARRLAPLTIELDGLDTDETYFQSLFATARPTPELLAAREAAQQAFPDVPATPYRPHVSLLYGHPPAETKRAIMDALRGTLPAAFEARVLTVNETAEIVSEWRCALRAPLAGQTPPRSRAGEGVGG